MAMGGRSDRSRLRPEIRAMLEEGDSAPPVDYSTLDPAAERAASEVRLADLGGAPEPVGRIDEVRFPSGEAQLKARIYRPAGAQGTVLFIHGGGWVVGSLDTHDNSCRMLANRAGCDVVSIEYRKAPEHRFPTGIQDCDAGLAWLLAEGGRLGLDTSRIVVCGESAGGNLAAVLAIHARDRGIALAGQALIYPVAGTSMDTASYRQFEQGFYLSAGAMGWFIRHYAAPEERGHPDIVPGNAASLQGLAPAFVTTVDHDPLRDEGRAYAASLIEAGNDVTFTEIKGAVHGVWVMSGVTGASEEIISSAARWICMRLADFHV